MIPNPFTKVPAGLQDSELQQHVPVEGEASGPGDARLPDTTRPPRGSKNKLAPAKVAAPVAEAASASKCRKPPTITADKAASEPNPTVPKLDRILALLRQPSGATIVDLAEATGWQAHSVRGAMAGALRKKGHMVLSEKSDDGLRRYRIADHS